MIERELLAVIKSHRGNSLGADASSLSQERAEAMDRYHGRPFGNEDEGRSAVVSRDLSETVDWALPAVMRVFTQSGNIGEFDPVSADDEELAQQESDAVNQVVMKDNDGFILLHDVCKDTMLLKNGYAKHFWDVTEKVTEERWEGWTPERLVGYMQQIEADGGQVEIKGQAERTVEIPGPTGIQQIPVFDLHLQIRRKEGRVRIMAVPCEELRISKNCRGSLIESPFVEHVTKKTRSALKEMGMPAEFVDTLPAYSELDQTSQEKLARDSVLDESDDIEQSFVDRSMEELEYCEAYLKVDWDGDGIAELRKVVTVADRIPPGDEWNEQIDAMPVTGGVIKRVPHRHVGESLHDELADLIEIKTTLERQLLDNVYLTNNNQWLVNERVNLADFLQSLPGGVKRVKGLEAVAGAVEPVVTTPIIGQVLPAIDYFDGIKQHRTGISESTTGLDPDILKQSTKGAFLENLNRASQKIEMITRMLAETFVKPMLLAVHDLMVRHQDKPRMMRLRGQFVEIDPTKWRERTDLTLRVGLGTGNSEEKQQKLMLIGQGQKEAAQMGLVNPAKVYNLFVDLAKTMGFDMPDKYIINPDPNNPEYQQMQQQMGQQKNPLVQVEEAKGQIQLQLGQQKLAADQHAAEVRAQADVAIAQHAAQVKADLEYRKFQLQSAQEDARHAREQQTILEKARIEAESRVVAADITATKQAGAAVVAGQQLNQDLSQ